MDLVLTELRLPVLDLELRREESRRGQSFGKEVLRLGAEVSLVEVSRTADLDLRLYTGDMGDRLEHST